MVTKNKAIKTPMDFISCLLQTMRGTNQEHQEKGYISSGSA
jgi:hypothetical protein